MAGIIVATVAAIVTGWQVTIIGEIPRTILLNDRLTFGAIPWDHLGDLIAPTISITALGAVESLLCGAVASKMTGVRLQANNKLIAQGKTLMLTSVNPPVQKMLERSGLDHAIGKENFFWSSDRAILQAEERYLVRNQFVDHAAVGQ